MNILFVDEFNVFDPSFGAEQRSNLLLHACCKIAQVDVVLFKQYKNTPDVDNCRIVYENNVKNSYTLWDSIKKIISFDYKCISRVSSKKREIIADFLCKKKYDYIVTRYVTKAINYGLLDYSDRLVIDIDDNPITCIINQINSSLNPKWEKLLQRLYLKIKLPYIKKAFYDIVGSIALPFVSNIEDFYINEFKCVHLPNVPFSDSKVDYCDFSVTPKRVIWVGLIDHLPNYLGLKHFFKFIYPKVLSRIPDFEVVVVGKYSCYDVSRWQNLQGVFVKGFVENLDPEYSSARAAIVPCYMGAGTNIKVLEALRMKRPCITSEFGARGYGNYFENNSDFLVCKNDDEFAESIIDMLESEQRNHEISVNGFEKVSKFFSKDGFINIVISSFSQLSE